MDFKLFENALITLPKLMGSKKSSKMIDGVFPRQHCVNTNLTAPEQLIVKAAFIEFPIFADHQLIKCI